MHRTSQKWMKLPGLAFWTVVRLMPLALCWPGFNFQAMLLHCVMLSAARYLSKIFSNLTKIFPGPVVLSASSEKYLPKSLLITSSLSHHRVVKCPQLVWKLRFTQQTAPSTTCQTPSNSSRLKKVKSTGLVECHFQLKAFLTNMHINLSKDARIKFYDL